MRVRGSVTGELLSLLGLTHSDLRESVIEGRGGDVDGGGVVEGSDRGGGLLLIKRSNELETIFHNMKHFKKPTFGKESTLERN